MKKLLTILTLLVTVEMSMGKTIYVNANYPTDGNGTSWSSPYTNLQTAVTASSAGDLILVTNGVYAPITTGNKAITIQSVEGRENTVIDGGGTARCATLRTGVVLDGFTIRNGVATDGGGTYRGSVLNSIIENCTASNNGGGSYDGTLTDCTISGNTADTYGGGSCYGTLTGCTISSNTATHGGGSYGGTLNGCTISGNTANANGGGCSYVTLTGCTISNNKATRGGGSSGSGGTLNGCTISSNTANYGGGSYDGTLTDCTISGNTANDYGGGSFGGTLTGCTISDNTADAGGGCYNGTLNSCLVVGNAAPTGPQIRNQNVQFNAYNSTIIGECSFRNNTGNIFNNVFSDANITFPASAQVGFNTFSGTLTGGTIVGPNLTATNPLFTGPANDDFTLLPTSPCINRGANQYVTTPTDLAGRPRIKDRRVDMGAYERQSTRFSTTPNALYPLGTRDNVGREYVQAGLIQWWDGYVVSDSNLPWPQLVPGIDNAMTMSTRADMYNAYTPTPGVGWVFTTNGTYRTRGRLDALMAPFFVSNGPPATIELVVTPRYGGSWNPAISYSSGGRGVSMMSLHETTPTAGHYVWYLPRSKGFQQKVVSYSGGESGKLFTVSAMFSGGNMPLTYVNATSKTLRTYSGPTTDSSSQTWIGGDNAFTIRGFIGTIHAIRIYNRILTEAEVRLNWELDVKRFGTP